MVLYPYCAVLPVGSVYRTCSVFTEQLQNHTEQLQNHLHVLKMVLYIQNHYRTIGWQH